MSSELRVNVLRGSTANGNITIQGEGTSNLGGATMQLQQGLAKVWCAFSTSTGTPTISDSLNSTSLTDNDGGDTTIVYTSNMLAAKSYTVSGLAANATDVTNFIYSSQPKQDDSVATGSVRLVQVYVGASSAANSDIAYVCNIIHGDLA